VDGLDCASRSDQLLAFSGQPSALAES
jgi:hypothetical protein